MHAGRSQKQKLLLALQANSDKPPRQCFFLFFFIGFCSSAFQSTEEKNNQIYLASKPKVQIKKTILILICGFLWLGCYHMKEALLKHRDTMT